MLVDTERAYRAVSSRDARFDGCFVTAVRSTGIYCRPSCPARTPKPHNVEFLPTTAAAQAAGYRACRRCLPDAVPGSPEWNLRADVAGRAMRLINDGVVERCGVTGLAHSLGYSSRHLSRVLTAELGAGPLALARAHRAHSARVLIETGDREFTDVAFAAGFASLRQFNDTIREVFATTPTALRERARGRPRPEGGSAGTIRLRLPFRPPFDADGLLRFLSDRAVPGVEEVVDGRYRRALRMHHGPVVAELHPRGGHVAAELGLADMRDLGSTVSRLRRLFDLDADPAAVTEVLSADPALAPRVTETPGVRVPGSVDGTETIVRAVLGQQVSVAAARTAARKLTDALGEPMTAPDGGVVRLFPTAEALATHADDVLGGPRRRLRTLVEVTAAISRGDLLIHAGRDTADLQRELREIPGVGPWTADYVAMRVLGAPDLLLDGDLALRRGASALGLPGQPAALREHARRWAPWRSYAGMHLWRAATSSTPNPHRQPETP